MVVSLLTLLHFASACLLACLMTSAAMFESSIAHLTVCVPTVAAIRKSLVAVVLLSTPFNALFASCWELSDLELLLLLLFPCFAFEEFPLTFPPPLPKRNNLPSMDSSVNKEL